MATQPMNVQDAPSTYAFKVGLVISHPTRDLTVLSALIGQEPDFIRLAGNPRLTPKGLPIGGFYSNSLWSKYALIENDKDFAKWVHILLERLLDIKSTFEDIAESGGSTKIIVQLPGEQNHGFELKAASACKLAALKIDFGLEVFPSFRKMQAAE